MSRQEQIIKENLLGLILDAIKKDGYYTALGGGQFTLIEDIENDRIYIVSATLGTILNAWFDHGIFYCANEDRFERFSRGITPKEIKGTSSDREGIPYKFFKMNDDATKYSFANYFVSDNPIDETSPYCIGVEDLINDFTEYDQFKGVDISLEDWDIFQRGCYMLKLIGYTTDMRSNSLEIVYNSKKNKIISVTAIDGAMTPEDYDKYFDQINDEEDDDE